MIPRETLEKGGLTRRQLLQLGTAATAAIAFTGCQPPPREFLAQSRARLAEDILSGYDNWYASVCRGCEGGCGILARVVEGRAKKIEGNPDHPINHGKLCVRGQALVQGEYHPDRIPGPLSRRGLRGPEGPLVAQTWDQSVADLTQQLRGAPADSVAVVTRPLRGHHALLMERFVRATGAEWLTLDPLSELPFRQAVRQVFGQERLPDFDIQNARYVLSFGANFLMTWLSPVQYGFEYGIFRQGVYRPAPDFSPRGERPRGHLVHVDSHFSGTAANADEWVPIRPGAEGQLALSIAQVIVSEGLANQAAAGAFGGAGALGAFAPEQVAGAVGVSAERIREIARAFAGQQPSLAIGGQSAGAHTNGTANLTAILALNQLVGAVGRPGGLRFNPDPPIDTLPVARLPTSLADWQGFVDRLNNGQISTVLVYDANPVYSLPPWLGIRDALLRTSFVASLSSFMDETTVLADLIMPSHLPLEDWGSDVPEPGPGFPTFTIQQPVVPPFFDTRSAWDVLLAVGEELGGVAREALPWRTLKDLLREDARKLQALNRGSVREEQFERFWMKMLQQGGWWDEQPAAAVPAAPAGTAAALPPVPAPQYAGSESEFPFHLVMFEHNSLGTGDAAHLPWAQSAPDPVTTVTWRTWVEVNPRVAADMGLVEGDVVAVESPQGRVEVPVYLNPAAPPNVLAIPMGQGHAAYGRWARDRGVNPIQLVAPLFDEATGALAYGATRVRVSKTGRRSQLPKYAGTVDARQLEHEEVLKVTRGDAAGGANH